MVLTLRSSVYPATWHEYEDQFNYFYNCHFIEQNYYDYLASGYPQANTVADGSSNDHADGGDDASDQDMDYYSDGSSSAAIGIDEDIGDIDVHMSSVNDPPPPPSKPVDESAPDSSHADIVTSSDQKQDKEFLS
ncbi:hypothetical protein LPJ53_004721 [Coemansia erecta]|uniref:Uncharacterized protein n=1 Tax=Coemansia erecta TaxID=147472 RepID=A0A9W7XXB4_9FUNG|nr:hypothetical protein LPJ53_004721 [Coemansia erecta]